MTFKTFLCILVALCQFSCNNQKKKINNELKGFISIDGSSTVYPITEAVAEEFRKEAPKVKVVVGVSGTGGGFKKFSRGETEISNASRSIKQNEATTCNDNSISFLEIPIAIDGLALVVHPSNDWADKLTVAELKKIWEPAAQGKIKKWNQIRPEWPAEEIHLFGPGTASGTYDCFADAICGKNTGTRGDYTASEDDNMLVQGIARDRLGLGFFGLAYYKENSNNLKLLAIDNGAGPILPSFETIKNGRYDLLSRPIFIYVGKVDSVKRETIEFVNFYIQEAATLSKEVGYIPLHFGAYKKSIKAFEKFCSSPLKH